MQEPGILKLSDRQLQQSGIRIGTVSKRNLVREIDATSQIVVDERRFSTITSWIPGKSRIEKLHVNFTGKKVEKGESLIELYNPNLDVAIEEYRLALEAHKGLTGDAEKSSKIIVSSSYEKLIRFGLSKEQISKLDKADPQSGHVPTVTITTPLSGTVIERLVEKGKYVNEGDSLLKIADLSKVWVYADIYESELSLVTLGQKVDITIRSMPDRVFEGTVAFIDPVVQNKSRTIRVRCDLDNAEGFLKPGMYARVQLKSLNSDLIAVPESAVLQSGRRNVVIVNEGGGRFRPKFVKLGKRYLYSEKNSSPEKEVFGAEQERYHEVLSGLSEGDKVVVAGNFLLNAEAQFQGILKKMIDASDLAEKAPKLPEDAKKKIESVLMEYIKLNKALVEDKPKEFSKPSKAINLLAIEAKKLLENSENTQIKGIIDRVLTSSEKISKATDLKAARKQFGPLSKELFTYLRDFAPNLVAEGRFHVFSCPMANDKKYPKYLFGYNKWIQTDPDLKNPYMGQMMLG